MKKLLTGIVLSSCVSATLFAANISTGACVGCHGQDWSKKALGKSQKVSEMTVEQIEKSLLGYKDGTYGGPLKGVMKGQVAKYSESELKEISKYIADNLPR